MSKADQSDIQQSYVASKKLDESDLDSSDARLTVSQEFSKFLIEDALDRYDLIFGETEHNTAEYSVELNNNCTNLFRNANQKLFVSDTSHACQNIAADCSLSESSSLTLTQVSSDLSTVQSCATLTQESVDIRQQNTKLPKLYIDVKDCHQVVASDASQMNNSSTDVMETSGQEMCSMAACEPSNVMLGKTQVLASCSTANQVAVELNISKTIRNVDQDSNTVISLSKADDNNNQQMSSPPACAAPNNTYTRVDRVHSVVIKQQQKSRSPRIAAAITADSRQYNVFTFFEDDVSIYDDDDEEGDNLSSIQRNSNHTSISSLDSQHGTTHVTTSSSAVIDCYENATPVHEMHLSHIAVEDDNMPDLDLPTIIPLPSESESSLPENKLKIIPSSPFEPDMSLSPASSLPSLYEFDGRHSLNDLDDMMLHNIDLDGATNSVFGSALDWEDTGEEPPIEPIPEYTAREELEDNKKWRVVQIGDKTYRIDMQSVDPYRKVLSHGGYYGNGLNAIIVFTACHLPEKTCPEYNYIMNNLFLYVMSTLELLVIEEYMIVYFHSPASRRRIPGMQWFKRCYDMIDHRLRKNLQGLLIVHPTLFLKAIMVMMKPFVSAKFAAKVHYVPSLAKLTSIIPTEYMFIPDEVLHDDRVMNPTVPIPCHKFVNY